MSSSARRLGFPRPRSSVDSLFRGQPYSARTRSPNNDSPDFLTSRGSRLWLRGGHPGVRVHEHAHSFEVAPAPSTREMSNSATAST